VGLAPTAGPLPWSAQSTQTCIRAFTQACSCSSSLSETPHELVLAPALATNSGDSGQEGEGGLGLGEEESTLSSAAVSLASDDSDGNDDNTYFMVTPTEPESPWEQDNLLSLVHQHQHQQGRQRTGVGAWAAGAGTGTGKEP
ncbi:unnamed protein product, partial [Discosporangium mesarthrocarpum]